MLLGEANAMTAAVHLHSVPRLRDGRRARITIVYALAFTSWFYLLPYPQFQVFAQEPACDVHVPLPSAVEEIGGLATFHDAPNGLLLFTGGSVFRYDGSTAVQIPSPNYTTGPEGDTLFDTSYGILLQGENGMFRYDGNGIVPVPGQWLGSIFAIQNTPGGTFIGSENGLFLYDGTRIARVHGQSTGRVLGLYFKSGRLFAVAQNGFFQFNDSEVVQLPGDSVESFGGFHDTPLGLLLLANKGLYFYNGKTFARVPGDTIDLVRGLHDLPGGLLVAGLHDLFRYDGLRVTRVPGDTIDSFEGFRESSNGLLVRSFFNLYRYDGSKVARVPGEKLLALTLIHSSPWGLLLGASNGLFRFDGTRVIRIPGEPMGSITEMFDTPSGLLILGDRGIFRYDGTRLLRDSFIPPSRISLLNTPVGLFLGSSHRLFHHNGTTFIAVPGDRVGDTAGFESLHYEANPKSTSSGMLIATGGALIRVVTLPLSSSRVIMTNSRELVGGQPNEAGILTKWTLTHPCATVADRLGLYVVSTNDKGKDVSRQVAVDFHAKGDSVSFEAYVPVPQAGRWTFRVVSSTTNGDVGARSDPVDFIVPGVAGWVALWWRSIVAFSGGLLGRLCTSPNPALCLDRMISRG